MLEKLLDQCSLEHLILITPIKLWISSECMFLPITHKNTNLKKLTISGVLIEPLSALLPNITSLTYLRIYYPVDDSDLLVLIDLVQSHTTLEVLELGMEDFFDEYGNNEPLVLSNLPGLIEAADNCQKKLDIYEKYYKVPAGEDEDDYSLPDDKECLADENVSSDEDNDDD